MRTCREAAAPSPRPRAKPEKPTAAPPTGLSWGRPARLAWSPRPGFYNNTRVKPVACCVGRLDAGVTIPRAGATTPPPRRGAASMHGIGSIWGRCAMQSRGGPTTEVSDNGRGSTDFRLSGDFVLSGHAPEGPVGAFGGKGRATQPPKLAPGCEVGPRSLRGGPLPYPGPLEPVWSRS